MQLFFGNDTSLDIKEEFFDILDKADDFIYKYEGEENELNYIKSNPEKFVFEGEYWGYGF